jgi:hypothetical protein
VIDGKRAQRPTPTRRATLSERSRGSMSTLAWIIIVALAVIGAIALLANV